MTAALDIHSANPTANFLDSGDNFTTLFSSDGGLRQDYPHPRAPLVVLLISPSLFFVPATAVPHHAYGRGFLEQLHPGPCILVVQYCFKICATQLTFYMKFSLFCFSHIEHVLKFKPLQRGKALYIYV